MQNVRVDIRFTGVEKSTDFKKMHPNIQYFLLKVRRREAEMYNCLNDIHWSNPEVLFYDLMM